MIQPGKNLPAGMPVDGICRAMHVVLEETARAIRKLTVFIGNNPYVMKVTLPTLSPPPPCNTLPYTLSLPPLARAPCSQHARARCAAAACHLPPYGSLCRGATRKQQR